MTSNPIIISEAETFLRHWSAEVTKLRDIECLCCYVARMLDEFPCDGTLRHAKHFRDQRAPRATALSERLGKLGGYCDCEIFLNSYQLPQSEQETDHDDGNGWEDTVLYVEDILQDDVSREPLPPCQGVRRGTVKPCGNWERIRRW